MQKLLLLVIVFFVILFFLYIPELFPYCACCRKRNPSHFSGSTRRSASVRVQGCRSVCSKCCRKYDLNDFRDLDRFMEVSRKLQIRRLSRDL